MRKKILFIDDTLQVGGIQSSMINMINTLIEEYDIDLFVYYNYGALAERLDNRVNLLDSTWRLEAFSMGFFNCIQNGSFKQKVFRLFTTIWAKLLSNEVPLKIAFNHQHIDKTYDFAIAYRQEGDRHDLSSGFCEFITSYINATKRFSWLHNDPVGNPIDESFNDKYYSKVDKVICVSNSLKRNFLTVHQSFDANKVGVCYNFLDFERINNCIKEVPQIVFDKTFFNCFSACRLHEVKGIPRAIKTLGSLFKQYNVKWYIAGDGPERDRINETIQRYDLNDVVFLLGQQTNPYQYYVQSDLIISCSYYEAAPMVYSEAKYLKIPVFTTEVSSSNELLENGRFGVVCKNNEDDMYKSFKYLMDNQEVLNMIRSELNNFEFDSSYFLDMFKTAIGDESEFV